MRFLGTPSRMATAPAALSSITAKIVGHTKCLGLEPRGYSEEEKKKILRAYRERGSKRAISRIFDISRCCVEPLARKKGRKADSVVDGLRPARENDVLELDECWTYVRKRSNKRWLRAQLCRRTRQVVANAHGDRSAKTCARLWSRIPDGYRQGKSFSDFWKSYRPVFEEEPTHRQVGKSSGELAHVERFFGRLRQKLARYVRRTRAASESERMLHLTTKLFVEWYNKAVT
ncbi:IS1 family transposase [Salinibacter ruber]|nr:IS1 family transposase [Salinibacter ruber]